MNCTEMVLMENDQIISDETNIADTVNKHFIRITKKPSETEANELKL